MRVLPRRASGLAKEQAFAEALISATGLTFASGHLGSAKSVPTLTRRS